jgi:hypothetical protein
MMMIIFLFFFAEQQCNTFIVSFSEREKIEKFDKYNKWTTNHHQKQDTEEKRRRRKTIERN